MKTVDKLQIVVVIAIFITTVSSTCKKSLICGDSISYSFQMPGVAHPNKDTIHIGDTIWIEINIPATLRDSLHGQNIDFSNASNLGDDIRIVILTGIGNPVPTITDANDNFSYILLKGTAGEITATRVRNFFFAETSGMYILKVGIVAKNVGIYDLGLGDPTNVFRRGDVCTKAHFSFSFGNTNQHFYIFQTNWPGYTIDSYEIAHTYFFKVY